MKSNKKGSEIISDIKWFFYGLRIRLFKKRTDKKKKNTDKKSGQTLFLFLFLLFPILQFIVFYIGVNFNSILLAFEEYDGVSYNLVGFKNFAKVLEDIFSTGVLTLPIKNSAIQFAAGLLIGMPMQIMVAYVVFKEVPLSGFFKIMLFMPNMISGMVFVIDARYLIQNGFPILFNNEYLDLLSILNSSSFYTVLVFGLWMQFANGLIVYLSAMCSISKDIMEYGQLEKLSSWNEFRYVVIPSIFPTITTYLVVAIAGFFTNYGFFYSFFGGEGRGEMPFDTLGYYFFVKVVGDNVTLSDYPYASAGGVLFTIFVAPITLFTKYMLEKYGPSED